MHLSLNQGSTRTAGRATSRDGLLGGTLHFPIAPLRTIRCCTILCCTVLYCTAPLRTALHSLTCQPGEHANCGPGNLAGGFTYDAETFMAARVGVYNFCWRDMGVPNLDRMMDIVQVRGTWAGHGWVMGGTWVGYGRDMGGSWAGHGRDMGGTWALRSQLRGAAARHDIKRQQRKHVNEQTDGFRWTNLEGVKETRKPNIPSMHHAVQPCRRHAMQPTMPCSHHAMQPTTPCSHHAVQPSSHTERLPARQPASDAWSALPPSRHHTTSNPAILPGQSVT